MKDKNRQFEETGAFLDVMSKREKKRWEKEQRKLMEEEKLAHNTENYNEQSNEIINNNPIINSPIEEENNFSESTDTVTEENNEENKDMFLLTYGKTRCILCNCWDYESIKGESNKKLQIGVRIL